LPLATPPSPLASASGSKRDYSKPWVIGSPAKKGGSGVADNKLFFSTSGYSLDLNDVAAASSSMPNSARSRPLVRNCRRCTLQHIFSNVFQHLLSNLFRYNIFSLIWAAADGQDDIGQALEA
jgi:hypothetical protein